MSKQALKIVQTFDFESVYQLYPRKGEGKKAGMMKLERDITTEAKFERFKKAVENYAYLCRTRGTEREYVKMWSTFVNNWEDYENAEDLGINTTPFERF
jgi:hypothetical protein